MLKSLISFSILFVTLALVATDAQATTGKQAEETCLVDSNEIVMPAPVGFHYKKATAQEVREARKQGQELVDYLFGERAEAVLKMTRLDRQFAGPTARFRVPELADGVNDWTPMPLFYGPAQKCARFILASIREQFVGAYEYGHLVFSHPIASGKTGKPTPTGDFQVWAKDPDHKSSLYTKHDIPGGIPCPMPWALQFRKGDCWLHAGNLSGIKASHGCVRQRLKNAKTLYDWAQVGDRVRVIKHL